MSQDNRNQQGQHNGGGQQQHQEIPKAVSVAPEAPKTAPAPAVAEIPSAISQSTLQPIKPVAPAPAPVAPEVQKAKAQQAEQEVIVEAIDSCAPHIGHLRLNLIKGTKYKVPKWVAETLVEYKMAVWTR